MFSVTMARYHHNIHHVHIADGFSSDCDELIFCCLKLKTLDYESFCNIWKELNFGFIYQGRNSGAEIAELSEEAMYIAKHYMVKDTGNFEESVAGLFLVYGILTLQPFSGFACLRLTPDDVSSVNRIEMVARRERRLDVLFILGEILVKYTQYCVTERDRGMESVLRKYLEGYTSIDKLGVRPRGIFFRQNEELDILRDLGSMTRQYSRAKSSLIGRGKDNGLQYINENLPTELSSSLKKVINGIIDHRPDPGGDDDDDDDDDDGGEICIDDYDNIQSIKQKAMTNTVNPMKHLINIEERQKAKEIPKNKSDLKTPTGSIRTSNPIKPITTKRKRKTESKRRRKKDKEPAIEVTEDKTGNIELDFDTFQKSNAGYIDSTEEDFDIELVTDQNLKLESLPERTQTENEGRLIEIQVVDNAKEKNVDNDVESDKRSNINSDGPTAETDELAVEKLADKDDDDVISQNFTNEPRTYKRKRRDMPVTVHSMEYLEPDKRPPRDLKRTKLKSKFKRLGILPIANFNEQK